MAEEELNELTLRDDFYRDSFGKVIFLMVAFCIAIAILVALSLYLHYTKPAPVTFIVDKDFRVQPSVSLDQPYLADADLLQWVSDALPNAFVFDFKHYNQQLVNAQKYFTAHGWKAFSGQLNNFANYNNIQNNKLFVNGQAGGAPFLENHGLLPGMIYGWWVKMPIIISYTGANQGSKQTVTFEVLVVRVPTTNNMAGVGIDNVIVSNNTGNAV